MKWNINLIKQFRRRFNSKLKLIRKRIIRMFFRMKIRDSSKDSLSLMKRSKNTKDKLKIWINRFKIISKLKISCKNKKRRQIILRIKSNLRSKNMAKVRRLLKICRILWQAILKIWIVRRNNIKKKFNHSRKILMTKLSKWLD